MESLLETINGNINRWNPNQPQLPSQSESRVAINTNFTNADTATPPISKQVRTRSAKGYQDVKDSFIGSTDPSLCTNVEIMKGENAKEPDIHICKDLPKNCIVYSFGINYNWIFDEYMHDELGCEVFSFDPSMSDTPKHYHKPKNLFEPIGIGTFNGLVESKSTITGQKVGYPVETLDNIMKRLNHTHINVLRMDTEGGEWDLLEQFTKEGYFDRFDQLLMEIHMTLPVSNRPSERRVHDALLSMLDSKLKLFHTAPNAWCQNISSGLNACFEIGMIRPQGTVPN